MFPSVYVFKILRNLFPKSIVKLSNYSPDVTTEIFIKIDTMMSFSKV